MKTLIRAIQYIRSGSDNTLSREDAKALGERIGIDWGTAKFSVEQFIAGFEEELEHGTVDPETNVTNDDPEMTGKIAWKQLKEDPTAYLGEVEKEGCDYPRTDPVVGLGTGNPEDHYQGSPRNDVGEEAWWVG